VQSVVLCPDGKRAIWVAEGENTVRLLNVATGKETGQRDVVCHCAFVGDQGHLAAVQEDGSLRLYDTTGRLLESVQGRIAKPTVFSISHDGKHAVVGNRREWQAFDLGQHRSQWSEIPDGELTDIAVTPDAQGALFGLNGSTPLKLVQLDDPSKVKDFAGQIPVRAVAVSPDGKLGLSGGDDQLLRVWDLSRQCEIMSLKGHARPIHGVAFSSDGKSAFSVSEDWIINKWNLSTGEIARTVTRPAASKTNGVCIQTRVAFSHDGRYALDTGVIGEILLYDMNEPEVHVERIDLATSFDAAGSFAFSPDSKAFLVTTERGVVLRFELIGERRK
jgi:WD40 repeat protein